MTRARSLSLLANTNALTVDANQNVGIGSTIPDARLDVNGNMNVSGTLTYEDVTNVETAGITTTGGLVVTGLGATIGGITTFFGDINFGGAGVGGTITPLGHGGFTGIVTALGFQASGVITATSFRGDGSELSGVDSSNLIDSGSTNRVAANTSGIVVTGIATVTGDVSIADKIIHTGDTNTAIRFPAADTFTVETAGSERFRITSGGVVLANTNAARSNFNDSSIETKIQIEAAGDNDSAALSIISNAGTTNSDKRSGLLVLGRTRGTSNGATTVVVADDQVGMIEFKGMDGTSFTSAASIKAQVDGSCGTDDMPGRLVFATSADGSGVPTERLRIDSSGRVLVGNTQDSSPFSWGLGLQVSGTSTNAGLSIRRDQNTSGGALLMFVKSRGSLNGNTVVQDGDQIGGMYFNAADGTDVNSYAAQIAAEIDGTPGSNDVPGRLKFSTTADGAASPTERLRIASSGQIGLGGANYGTSGQVLTSNGSSAAVTWEDASGGGGITTQVGNASGIVTSMFLTDAIDHKITATGICTITTTQAGIEGQSHTIRIVNSGVANVGFSTYFLFPSGSTPSLPTADGAVSLISFTVHDSVGAGCTQLLAGASVNFS